MLDFNTTSPKVRFALCIMRMVHFDTYDKAGKPYENHPLALASVMDTEEEICVALLHDAIEDAKDPDNIRSLIRDSFPTTIYNAVEALTRPNGMVYADYIDALRTNYLASKVKLADLAHNLDLTRIPENARDQYLSLGNRYKRAAGNILAYNCSRHPDLWKHWQKCCQTFLPSNDEFDPADDD